MTRSPPPAALQNSDPNVPLLTAGSTDMLSTAATAASSRVPSAGSLGAGGAQPPLPPLPQPTTTAIERLGLTQDQVDAIMRVSFKGVLMVDKVIVNITS